MYVIDYKHVLCFGPIEYKILLKLLHGEKELTDSEEERAEQMYRTIISMKKAKEVRERGYTRPVRSVPAPTRRRDPSESDVMQAITNP
jgi:hypothetical protein